MEGVPQFTQKHISPHVKAFNRVEVLMVDFTRCPAWTGASAAYKTRRISWSFLHRTHPKDLVHTSHSYDFVWRGHLALGSDSFPNF